MIGIDPEKWYRMRTSDYVLMVRGHKMELDRQRELLKTVCASIASVGTSQYPVRAAMEYWGVKDELTIEEFRVLKAKAKLKHGNRSKTGL